ncbi:MAG: hypothetical protein DWQ29_12400 [Planctomycetota bacterium]|nr:MAG: hypothetical protein DWQ29_12400 [Planctomycetota bacterium]
MERDRPVLVRGRHGLLVHLIKDVIQARLVVLQKRCVVDRGETRDVLRPGHDRFPITHAVSRKRVMLARSSGTRQPALNGRGDAVFAQTAGRKQQDCGQDAARDPVSGEGPMPV